MESERKFRTKTGFCHVTADKVILTRDGIIGNVAKVTVGNSIFQILIIYGLMSFGLLYFAYDSYLRDRIFLAIFFGVVALYLINGILRSLNNSATPIIERKDIRAVTYKKGMLGLTRSRFEIEFNQDGKVKKRLIMLPGSMNDGENEMEKAVQILKEEKILNG